MIGKLLKAVAYAKAPKATFMVLHPVKSVHLKHLKYDMKHSHAYAPRIAALGAVALALPLGMLLGRMGRGNNNG